MFGSWGHHLLSFWDVFLPSPSWDVALIPCLLKGIAIMSFETTISIVHMFCESDINNSRNRKHIRLSVMYLNMINHNRPFTYIYKCSLLAMVTTFQSQKQQTFIQTLFSKEVTAPGPNSQLLYRVSKEQTGPRKLVAL